MKLIALITAHKNEAQINRLISAMAHPDISIYIHIDKKSQIKATNLLPEARIIQKSIRVDWSEFSQVESTLNSLKEIVDNEPDFDYISLISGQDYPIMPLDAIISFLTENSGKELIAFNTINQKGWNKAQIRYERFYFNSYKNQFIKFTGSIITFVCDKLRWKRRFYNGMEPYGGSSWWTLSKDCILHILNYTETHKGLLRFMKKTIHADEILFQTIILNTAFKDRVVNNNYRYIEWEKFEGNANPNILTSNDYHKIINSQMHFARKFDIKKDEKILNLIDDYLNREKG
ncbi:MAG: hypothetical protein NT004_11470 [Bacteroidetes bacterium]|nr:hypothetical protein [Bacteroidota bacterium]